MNSYATQVVLFPCHTSLSNNNASLLVAFLWQTRPWEQEIVPSGDPSQPNFGKRFSWQSALLRIDWLFVPWSWWHLDTLPPSLSRLLHARRDSPLGFPVLELWIREKLTLVSFFFSDFSLLLPAGLSEQEHALRFHDTPLLLMHVSQSWRWINSADWFSLALLVHLSCEPWVA